MFEATESPEWGHHVRSHEDPANPFPVMNLVHLPDENTARAMAMVLTMMDWNAARVAELEARVRELESPGNRGRLGF